MNFKPKVIRDFVFYVVIVSALFLGTNFTLLSPVQALETVLTSSDDWQAGVLSNLDASVKEGDLSLEPTGIFGARSWRTPDLTLSVGTALTSDGNNIYVMRGLGDVLFWRYDSTSNSWTTLANLPRGAYFGSELEYLDGYVYALFGAYQNTFARYSVADNEWEIMSDFPGLVHSGASLENDGENIYALRGASSQDFYRYDVADDSWTPLTGPPATIGAGADLVRVGIIYIRLEV